MDPQEAQKMVERDSTQMVDPELATKLTSGKEGLIARAPTYISENLIDIMDMFVAASKPLKVYSKYKAEEVKSVQTSLEHQLKLVAGGWEDEFVDLVKSSFL